VAKGKIIIASLAVIAVLAVALSTLSESEEQTITQTKEEPKTISETMQASEPTPSSLPRVAEAVPEPIKTYSTGPECAGEAQCISGFVTRIVDGDTIVVGDKSIRFALVNTPEWGDYDYSRATHYIENICPVGSKVLVDEDDGQTQGSFGRIIGKIYCNNLVLNEEILEVGHAVILQEFCSVSEFAGESWATKHGC
jgi:micrococcal nuclease